MYLANLTKNKKGRILYRQSRKRNIFNIYPEVFISAVCLSNDRYIQSYYFTDSLALWEECSPMVRETGVQSPDRVIPKTLKMVLDASLLNTQHYKVRIKGKVEQSRERSSDLFVLYS